MSELDQAHELLAEQFGVDLGRGRAISEHIDEVQRQTAMKAHAEILGAILGEFLKSRSSDAGVIFWALAYQSGLAKRLTNKNPAQKAKELGVTRALMSHWGSVWKERFKFLDLTYSKNEDARANMSKARRQYLSTK